MDTSRLRTPAIRRKEKSLFQAALASISHNYRQNWQTWGFHRLAVRMVLPIRSMEMRMLIRTGQQVERVSRELVAVAMDDKASREKEAGPHHIWLRRATPRAYPQSQEEVIGGVMAQGQVRLMRCYWLCNN